MMGECKSKQLRKLKRPKQAINKAKGHTDKMDKYNRQIKRDRQAGKDGEIRGRQTQEEIEREIKQTVHFYHMCHKLKSKLDRASEVISNILVSV